MGLLWSPEDARITDSVLISITRIPETGWLKQQTFISRGSGVSAAQDGSRLGSGVHRRWDKQASFGKKRQPTGLCLEAYICKEWVSFS